MNWETWDFWAGILVGWLACTYVANLAWEIRSRRAKAKLAELERR